MPKILLDCAAMRKVIGKNRGITTIDTDCRQNSLGYKGYSWLPENGGYGGSYMREQCKLGCRFSTFPMGQNFRLLPFFMLSF